jgi:heptosyltransferase II
MRIAIFLPNWLGDLVMATPALRAVRRHFGPQTHIVGILRPYLAEVLGGTGWLDQQWFFDPRAKDRSLHAWAVAQRMRQQRFDLALLLPNSLRTALVAWLGRARQRIGYVRNGRGPLLTGKLYPQRTGRRIADVPVVDAYLGLAEVLGCPQEPPRLELAVTQDDDRSAAAVWKNLGLRTDGQVIALNSGSSNGPARSWPAEYFAQLATRIVDHLDHDVLVMCGPGEQETARQIVRNADRPRVFSMVGQPLGLGTSKACLRRVRAMVSTDSGPRHVAAAFGKPVVTLRGPTVPIWSYNPTVRAVDLHLNLDCVPCRKPVCPLGHHKCMRELSVDMVFAAVNTIVEG